MLYGFRFGEYVGSGIMVIFFDFKNVFISWEVCVGDYYEVVEYV